MIISYRSQSYLIQSNLEFTVISFPLSFSATFQQDVAVDPYLHSVLTGERN